LDNYCWFHVGYWTGKYGECKIVKKTTRYPDFQKLPIVYNSKLVLKLYEIIQKSVEVNVKRDANIDISIFYESDP